MPPLETLLGAAELWRPAARGTGGWATAAALLLLLAAHLSVLLVRRRRRQGRGRVSQQQEDASPAAPASEPASSGGSSAGVEGLVTEDDLRQLVASLGVGAREPELEGWVPVIAKSNDAVSYKAWCDKTTDGPPKYLSVTTYEGCSTELLRDFYMDNEYRMEWDNTVIKHEQLQCDENSGIEIGRTVKKFPLLTPREYILAWRVWASDENSFYCLVKECEHCLAPIQRKFVRVRLLRSGWCIRKVPGRDACEITVLHHEDNGMNIDMAKLAFSKGIWNYICKMNNALRRYPQNRGPSISISTMRRLTKKFPWNIQINMDESNRSPVSTAAAVVPLTPSGTSPCKQLVKKSSRETIASGLLLVGSIVCLSKGRSNLGAQLAMAFFLKKAFKKDKESGSSPRGRTEATMSMH